MIGRDAAESMIVERDMEIPMADGIVLAADVFRPVEETLAPVIMSMGPYGKGIHFRDGYGPEWEQLTGQHPEILEGSSGEHMVWELADPERWVPDGYAMVRVDSRGAGRSGGHLDCFSAQEAADFYQAVEWAASRPWSSGKVGLCGISYYAMSQWLVAALQPPHLAAIIVWEGAQDFYRDVTHHGGILSNVFPDMWYRGRVVRNQHGQGERGLPDRGVGGLAAGPETLPEEELASLRSDLPNEIRAHPLYDDYHKTRTADLSQVKVPLLSAANWADFGLHSRGNFYGYAHAASTQKWLQVHGGRHEEWFYLPDSRELQHRFFDHFLKGIDNGWHLEPPVQLNIRQPDGRYQLRKEHQWPLARTHWRELYFDADTSQLLWEPPTSQGTVTFDALGPGVTFRTAPLEGETEITGPLAATLTISTSTTDADVFTTLQAFLPDGKEITFVGATEVAPPLAQGWLRLSHRRTDPARSLPYQPFHPHDRIEPAESDRPYQVQIEIWPTSLILPAGSFLSVTITGRDFARGVATQTTNPADLVNRGSGPFIHCDPGDRPLTTYGGRTTIHTGVDAPSRLLVPIIPPRGGAGEE